MGEGTANPAFVKALSFAVEAHGNQPRKGTTFPYVIHPIRVAEILDLHGCAEHVVIAGFLHDLTEDAGITLEEIALRFSADVARLVEGASEADKTEPWRVRRERTIAAVPTAAADVLELVAADKLDHVRSLREAIAVKGAKRVWARFNAGKEDQCWYYRTIAAALLETDPESRLFRTLDFEVQTLFPNERRTTRFFPGKPLGTPHDARAFLADPIKHWRPNYSAQELAKAWIGAGDVPPAVAPLLRSVFGDYDLVEAFFEKETRLATPGRPSQTDLLAVIRTGDEYVIVGVEGKAREPFGDLVSQWDDGSAGKKARLADLCDRLGLTRDAIDKLRYQLLHRTVAVLIEAERYGARQTVMLVHSFGPADESFGDYRDFAAALGLAGVEVNCLTSPKVLSGITLRLGWVKQPENSTPTDNAAKSPTPAAA